MTRSELEMVIGWAIKEGWNFGKHDIDAYYETYPESFKLLLLDEKPIGGISIVIYDNNFAFLGLFIVDKAYRGSGYGAHLWNWSMSFLDKELGNKGISGLYAVPKQISRYQLSGYQVNSALQRWQGLPSKNELSVINKNIINISNNINSLFNQVLEYDKKVFSAGRESFIKNIIKLPQTKAFIYYDDQKISGYGILRPCQNGFRLGPLYADSLESAKSLAEALFNTIARSEEPIFMDSPTANKFIQLFIEYFNLSHVSNYNTTFMFKGECPKYLIEHIDKNYAVASLELG